MYDLGHDFAWLPPVGLTLEGFGDSDSELLLEFGREAPSGLTGEDTVKSWLEPADDDTAQDADATS